MATVSAVRIYTICDTRDCPAVAQPGRAFGCRCWLTEADQVKQPTGLTKIETEESQAQTSDPSNLEQILPAGYHVTNMLSCCEAKDTTNPVVKLNGLERV